MVRHIRQVSANGRATRHGLSATTAMMGTMLLFAIVAVLIGSMCDGRMFTGRELSWSRPNLPDFSVVQIKSVSNPDYCIKNDVTGAICNENDESQLWYYDKIEDIFGSTVFVSFDRASCMTYTATGVSVEKCGSAGQKFKVDTITRTISDQDAYMTLANPPTGKVYMLTSGIGLPTQQWEVNPIKRLGDGSLVQIKSIVPNKDICISFEDGELTPTGKACNELDTSQLWWYYPSYGDIFASYNDTYCMYNAYNRVYMRKCNVEKAQQWVMGTKGGILNTDATLLLTVTWTDSIVRMEPWLQGRAVQQWQLKEVSRVGPMQLKKISSSTTDYCMAIWVPENGANAYMWECIPDEIHQLWWYYPGTGALQSELGSCLRITDGYSTVQGWACDANDKRQQWKLTRDMTGTMTIENVGIEERYMSPRITKNGEHVRTARRNGANLQWENLNERCEIEANYTYGYYLDLETCEYVYDVDTYKYLLDWSTWAENVKNCEPNQTLCKRATDEVTKMPKKYDKDGDWDGIINKWNLPDIEYQPGGKSSIFTYRNLRIDRQRGPSERTVTVGNRRVTHMYQQFAIQLNGVEPSPVYASIMIPVGVEVGLERIRNAFRQSQASQQTVYVIAPEFELELPIPPTWSRRSGKKNKGGIVYWNSDL